MKQTWILVIRPTRRIVRGTLQLVARLVRSIYRILFRITRWFIRYTIRNGRLGYQYHNIRKRRTSLDMSQVAFDASIVSLTILVGIAQAII